MMIKKRGFSLIELLVVISIIGVLSAVLMVNFVGTRERARDSQKVQDLNSLKSALRLYYNDNQKYPEYSNVPCSNPSLVNEIKGYFPNITSLNCLNYNSNGDSFTIRIQLESPSGATVSESQRNCGVSLADDIYVVCAN